MTTEHPMILELVENTLMDGRGFWRFYDYINCEGSPVLRVVK